MKLKSAINRLNSYLAGIPLSGADGSSREMMLQTKRELCPYLNSHFHQYKPQRAPSPDLHILQWTPSALPLPEVIKAE